MDVLLFVFKDFYQEMFNYVRELCGCDDISYNKEVVQLEMDMGFCNVLMVFLFKFFNNFNNSLKDVLDLYFYYCFIEMSCVEFVCVCYFFVCCSQLDCWIFDFIISQLKCFNVFMQICGFYDEFGEFFFMVGLLGKSGVGGGIVVVYFDYYSIVVWSFWFNKKGNFIFGMKMLELFIFKFGMLIFQIVFFCSCFYQVFVLFLWVGNVCS